MHWGGIRDDGGNAAAGDDCAEVSVYAGGGGGGYAVFFDYVAAEVWVADAGASAHETMKAYMARCLNPC